MALAILELISWENGNARFRMDTGTNALYQFKVGTAVRSSEGMEWVDDVFFSTPMTRNERSANLLRSAQEITVPVPAFEERKAYVQLCSYKTPQGKSPAYSRPVLLPKGMDALPPDFALPFSMGTAMNTRPTNLSFQPPRRIPCRTHREVYAQQASLEELLAGVVKLAAPVVLDFLKSSQSSNGQKTATNGGGTAGNALPADLIAQLLGAVLGSVGGGGVGKVLGQSLSVHGGAASVHDNRFLGRQEARYSQSFIAPALIPIIGAAIGPLIQALPQLMNAANQQRLQMKQADNKLVTYILSDFSRRRMIEQLLQAQQESAKHDDSQANGETPVSVDDVMKLLEMLQQQPANPQQTTTTTGNTTTNTTTTNATGANTIATTNVGGTANTTAGTNTANTAQTKSLPTDAPSSNAPVSSKAVLSFVTGAPISWNGTPHLLYAPENGIQLKIKFNVTEPVPKMPLPKAIIKVVFKSLTGGVILFEKVFQEKNVAPNATLPFRFEAAELARLPLNTPIGIVAELRWLTPQSGKEGKALGSMEMILVGKYFVKAQGMRTGEERELTDMNLYRPFWNKIWEAPVQDAASGRNGERRTRWELDVNLKYSVLLSASHASNGVMESKILQGEPDKSRTYDRTEGRMKAGIELSLAELNKLISLWDGETLLDADKLQAFQTEAFARENASEFITHCKLKGRSGERGMVWVIPIFALFQFSLHTVSATDNSGQVTAVGEETVRFPLPVSARVLGLKSE